MHDESRRSPGHVLVVDDEPFIRNAFQLYLETHGYRVSSAGDGEEALDEFRDKDDPVDLILLDLVMPGVRGLDLLRQFKGEHRLVEVVIATGCGNMNSAIEALRLGAFDYITKPIVDFDRDLLTVVQKAIAHRRRKLEHLSNVKHNSGPTPQDEAAQFHDKLESLAESLSHRSGRDSALSLVEDFLEEHLQAAGGLVADYAEYSVSFRHGWGVFDGAEEAAFTPPDTTDLEFWHSLLKNTAQWQEISPDAHLLTACRAAAEAKEPLEVLQVPLVPATGEREKSATLYVFRHRKDGAPESPPPTALLALVVNAALSKSMVTSPA